MLINLATDVIIKFITITSELRVSLHRFVVFITFNFRGQFVSLFPGKLYILVSGQWSEVVVVSGQ